MGDQFKNPPVVIGHSMGGLIGQKYLEVHRAPAGILVAASPRGIIVTATRMTMAHPLQTLRAGWNRDTPPSSVLHGSRVNCSSPDRLPNPLSCGARRASSGKATGQCLRPMLVLGAGQDRLVPRRHVYATVRAYGTPALFRLDTN